MSIHSWRLKERLGLNALVSGLGGGASAPSTASAAPSAPGSAEVEAPGPSSANAELGGPTCGSAAPSRTGRGQGRAERGGSRGGRSASPESYMQKDRLSSGLVGQSWVPATDPVTALVLSERSRIDSPRGGTVKGRAGERVTRLSVDKCIESDLPMDDMAEPGRVPAPEPGRGPAPEPGRVPLRFDPPVIGRVRSRTADRWDPTGASLWLEPACTLPVDSYIASSSIAIFHWGRAAARSGLRGSEPTREATSLRAWKRLAPLMGVLVRNSFRISNDADINLDTGRGSSGPVCRAITNCGVSALVEVPCAVLGLSGPSVKPRPESMRHVRRLGRIKRLWAAEGSSLSC
mmetsp:Transcript_106008/g.182854  ORF Transcript_106008/g.182854 Transcript_106008/m.182854 type:complete len:347 (+) Transcript_106008:430-1470(+)